jgi:hypothetical protein
MAPGTRLPLGGQNFRKRGGQNFRNPHAGLGLYGFWLYVQIGSWWVPYFRGVSPQFMRFYEHWFGNTYKFLPPIDGHPVPDAEHTVIAALLVTVLTFSAIAICKSFRSYSKEAA